MHLKHLIAAAALGATLAGCASTSDEMAEKGIAPMTADQLEATFPGNTAYIKGSGWEWAGYYADDGTIRGRSWWSGGEETATASYEITDDGLICRDWDNNWGSGGYGCSRYYQDGDKIVYDAVSGSKGKYPTGTLTVSEGNSYGL